MIHPGSSLLSVNQQSLSKVLVLCLMVCLLVIPAKAQTNPFAPFFEEAYRLNPSIPAGVLEAIAYTNTRMNHLKPIASCQGLPEYFGVMGLISDGKGYFQNTLPRVAELSGFTEQQIAADPRMNILAYAKAYASVQQNKRLTNKSIENHAPILAELSEIPQDNSAHNKYALDQQFYSVLTEMKTPHSSTQHRLSRNIDMEKIFGKENYKILSAKWVNISSQRVSGPDGEDFSVAGSRAADCTSSNNIPDYANAIWNPAHRNNFGSRGGTSVKFVTIHTIQGSYASAISWFRNPAAGVSSHYVIRASDGQVTQMVCEKDRAFHVKTDNASAIGIEHEGFIDDGGAWYTNEMYESSAALVRNICSRYGIDPLKTFGGPPTNGVRELSNTCYHIKGHQHFRGNNHIDPGLFWDWNRYYRLINPTPPPKTFTDRRGDVFDSGNANGNYGDQERTTYLIKPADASSVSLTFKSFELEGTRAKPFDYLDIYDGEDINGRYIGRFTGNTSPGEILAKSGSVFMEFRSDCQKNKKGWHIQYTSRRKNPNCPNPSNLVASNLFPMGATLSWDKVDGADMYLVYLSRQLEDKWALYKTRSNSVTATGLSANGLYQWQIQVICDGDTSALVGDSFVTPNIGRKGAAQTYTVRLNQGRFYDSGGTFSGYANNENYLYRIIPSNKGRVVLKFLSFDTEDGKDILSVYDGKSTNSRKIGTFSGKSLPKQITSSGNGLTLVFKSDGRTTKKGWTSSWKTIGGSGTVVDNGNTSTGNTGNTGNNNNNNTGSIPDNSDFEPEIKYHVSTPESSPILKNSYTKSFTLKFKDKDRSGRGLANKFYNIAQETPGGFRSNPELGYFYEDFNAGFHSSWKSAAGNWQVVDGRLNQTNIAVANSNLWTELKQTSKDVFVYHWKAKMTGSTDNKRHGIHFFASKPANENRGDSYFVWVRDSEDKDYIEIYKTDNDKFDRKVRKEIRLEVNKVYDYKTIYNPSKGRIEVYLNDRFIVSWVDRFPLKQGKGISLRSGNCVVSYDDVQVYKKRGSSVNVSMGNKSSDDLKNQGRFKVNSLVVDRNIRWSRVGSGTSIAGVESNDNDDSNNTGNTGVGDNGNNSSNSGIAVYKKDFEVPITTPSGGKSFYLPSDLDGNLWRANPNLGFFADEFSESRPHKDWRLISGKWSINNGALAQTDAQETNANIFTPITQISNSVYLYHWKAKVISRGDNRRFGLHFFASNGTQSNRGDSYFVWFRNYDSKDDKVEIYRVDNNEFALRESSIISIKPGEQLDCKVLYNPSNGLIEVWLNNSKVMSWKDNKPPLTFGSAISFRTGNSAVEFDDLKVYQMSQSPSVKITVGSSFGKMIRFKSKGEKPAARIHQLTLDRNGRWTKSKVEARIE